MKTGCFLFMVFGLLIYEVGHSQAQNCSTTCRPSTHDANETDTCDVTSGKCLYGCQGGYTGVNCTVECPVHCAEPILDKGVYCNETTLECNFGCNVGYTDSDCNTECPTNCKHPLLNGTATCDSTSGECNHGCNNGFVGPNCTVICPQNCVPPIDEDTEEMCNASTNECLLGCIQGFAGSLCDVECPANCAVPIQAESDICDADTENCTYGCQYGFTGSNCSTTCPSNCAPPTANVRETCNTDDLECSSGCVDGFMGPKCDQLCPQNCRSPEHVCDAVSGDCFLGCDHGYAGNDCSFVCPQNCNPPSDNVTDTCNVTSSECLAGCTYGFAGPTCSVPCPENCGHPSDPLNATCDADTKQCSSGCLYGFTGDNCTVPCPDNCAMFPEGGDQTTCDATTLECTNGCDVTFTGPYCNESCPRKCDRCMSTDVCTECTKDTYREQGVCTDCAWQCLPVLDGISRICREDDGRCELGCQVGYYGQRCRSRCSSGCKNGVCERLGGRCTDGCVTNSYTGLTCSASCNDGCKDKLCEQDGVCLNGCYSNFWGETCDKFCNDNCRAGLSEADNICNITNGRCEFGCKNDSYWESQCTRPCSEHCEGGVCEHLTGECTNGCTSDTVYGAGCTELCSSTCMDGTCTRDGYCKSGCLEGWYGDRCERPCGSECRNSVCDRDDGSCTDGCNNGWYGTHCTELCGLNCVNKTCHIDTGNCTFGCVFGSEGAKCDKFVTVTPAPPLSIDKMWIYVGVAVAGVIVIGIVVIIILVARRRKIIIERRRRTTMYENYPDGLQEQVERRERKKKKGPVARITQMLVENPLALLMRGNKEQDTDDDVGAHTMIAVDDLLDIVVEAEKSGGNEEFNKLTTGLTKPHTESRKLENLALNFFSEIFPYDENRVVLGHGKRQDGIGGHQHSIIKHRSHDNRHGLGLSVHFTGFGKSSKSVNNKNTTGVKNDNAKIAEDATGELGNGDMADVDSDQVNIMLPTTNPANINGQTQTENPYDNNVSPKTEKRDYINASYIKAYNGKVGYIAAQAPAKSTVNDFWLMVWEQQCPMIVMLTGTDNEGNLKCDKYWPDAGNRASYGNVSVTCESCDIYSLYTIRKLKIKQVSYQGEDDDERTVIQHQFTDWPVNGCPPSAITFIEFYQKYKSMRSSNTDDGPVVVHCTAGVGRTGVFIGMDILVDEGTETGYVNVYKCVDNMREQRVNMVPGNDQYDFLYKAVAQSFALQCQLVNRASLQDMLTELRKLDIEHGGKQKMEYLFQNLRDSLILDTSEIASLDVVQERSRKDRPTSDIPDMLYRADMPNGVYVNAVMLNCNRCRDCIVTTQMPTPHTLSDFVQLVVYHRCDTVVMLNGCDPNDKSLGVYWPKVKKHLTIGNVKITNIEEDKKSDIDFVIRTLKLESKQPDQGSSIRQVTMIQYKGWKIVKNVPSVKNLLKIVSLCRNYVNKTSDKHLLVHCMNGSEQSGLFCTLYNIVDKLDFESDISITSIVRSVLARLPGAIRSATELKTCFSLACTCIGESAFIQDQLTDPSSSNDIMQQ